MTTYAVTAARYEDGMLVALQGQETHGLEAKDVLPQASGELREFSVSEVLGLIAGGHKFFLFFVTAGGSVPGGGIVPDGAGSIREERGDEGRCISDLPRF